MNNPGGRLPITFYSSLSQLPSFEDYSMRGRTYRYFIGKPSMGSVSDSAIPLLSIGH
jgi:beta-glucosidase